MDKEKVISIIAEQMSIEEDKVTMDSSFTEDLGADSLDIVELIMALEEAFDIEIPDEDVEKANCVGDVVEYIQKLL